MIVLDEQLMGRNLERKIARWYRGSVRLVTEFQPHTIIKDDAIPRLLCRENKPTFVTINVKDFWRKIPANDRFCIICIAWSDSRANSIPAALRTIFKLPAFATKSARMGKIVRVGEAITYYSRDEGEVNVEIVW
jgi:hypothetical protein